jgi:hypothetical protein
MTGIKYTRGPVPMFKRLGDIKQPDGYEYSLFVFSGSVGGCYLLCRVSQKNRLQVFDYITHESALEMIRDPNFEKTDHCREFLAMLPQEPAKEQWDLKTLFGEKENNIIYFPAPAGTQAPDPAERSAPYEEPMSPFSEHREAFKGVDLGGNPADSRILWALYRNRIHSIEALAGTPAAELLECRRIGRKTLEQIQAALESKGVAGGARSIPKTAAAQQEN